MRELACNTEEGGYPLIGSSAALTALGRFEESYQHASQAIKIFKTKAKTNSSLQPKVVEALYTRTVNQYFHGMIMNNVKLLEKAKTDVLETERIFSAIFPNGHADLAEAKVWLVWIYFNLQEITLAQGKVKEAIKYYE